MSRRRVLLSRRLCIAASAAITVLSGLGAVSLEDVSPAYAQGMTVQQFSPSYTFGSAVDVSSDGTHVWLTDGGRVAEFDATTGALVQLISGSSYGFSGITNLVSDGTHVWVANHAGNSVTELDASTGALVQVISDPGYGLDAPRAISSDGTDVWVTNQNDNSVTELDASTGALVQVISDPSYGFGFDRLSNAISSDGTNVWVGNGANNSVTELDASTGALVQVISGFDHPDYLSADGTHVWVAGSNNDGTGSNSVTELDASTGAVVQVLSGDSYGLDDPMGIASDGTDVWVTNQNDNSVTELAAATGALVRVIYGGSYSFDAPDRVASDGTHVWVANSQGDSLTELSASTGAFAQVIQGSNYGFVGPDAVSSDGNDVWVANQWGNSVTEVDATTGAFVQLISGASYGFDNPGAISADGPHVWVLNGAANSVTELDASTGALVQVISLPGLVVGTGYGGAISSDGTHVWVETGGQVSELDAATGAVVQELSWLDFFPGGPSALSSDGTHLWAMTPLYGVSEIDASTGALVQKISATSFGFDHPEGISSDGTHVWVTNGGNLNDGTACVEGESVTELSAATGKLVKILTQSSYGFAGPNDVVSDGTDVWVSNDGDQFTPAGAPPGYQPCGKGGGFITEINATTGALVQTLPNLRPGLGGFSADGTNVWFLSGGLTEISPNYGTPMLRQSVTFTSTPPAGVEPGDAPYSVSATGGGSGNPVTFSSDTSSVCTVSGSSVSFLAVGTCAIEASQAGNATYASARPAIQAFTVGPVTTVTPPAGIPPAFAGAASGVGGSAFTSCVPGSSTIKVTGYPTPTITATGLDSGFTFTDNGDGTATIASNGTGSGGAGGAGGFEVNLTATNTAGTTTARWLVNIMDGTPLFTSATSANLTVKVPFSMPVNTCSGLVPKLTVTGLPKGLIFKDNGNGSGTIYGTPETAGAFTATVQAVITAIAPGPGQPGRTGELGTSEIDFRVDGSPTFKSRASYVAYTGTAISDPITTIKGYPAPAITTTSVLPAGVSLIDNGDGTASLTGTPDADAGGVYPITVTATNGVGAPVTRNVTLTVYQAPMITSAASDTITDGVSMLPFSLTATGFPTPIFKIVDAPMGIRISGNAITGTTQAAPGTYNVMIIAKSRAGSTTQSFALTVNS